MSPRDSETTQLVLASARAMTINADYETQVLTLTNQRRVAAGCPRLRLNLALRKAARTHSLAMARAQTMSHRLPGEPYFSRRITQAGYTGWTRVAENIARGYAGPRSVVRAWMASPSHRRNILDCTLRELGVGVVMHTGGPWWSQEFGRR